MRFLLYAIGVLLLSSIMSWGSMMSGSTGSGSGNAWRSSSGSGSWSSGGHK